jgi:putative SOS response-associated peptidase YedK
MCGRFTLTTPAEIVAQTFGLAALANYEPRYNIAPTQPALTVRNARDSANHPEAALLRWGLVPSWAEDPAIGNRLINARAETVAEKPSFRTAFRRRRCIVVADGFYEWAQPSHAGGRKRPHWIHSADGGPMGLAGIWESWSRGEAAPIESFAIITTAANELMEPIHRRMPVVLDRDDHERWLCLQSDPSTLEELLMPCPNERLSVVEVGLHVNDPRHDDPACVRPVS